ncbi:hypothetical protein E2C01_093481 [Portunus trituberculatus]|uniref:Uncharacterized protein n=1 Tax=Portunus trituberculatus TaxID=210409 RepID=A0A5B7JYU7_PORTR|nr:hypothetical protein [Portunus trituberculatus]
MSVFLRASVPFPPLPSCRCPAATQDVLAPFLRHALVVSAAVQILDVALHFLASLLALCACRTRGRYPEDLRVGVHVSRAEEVAGGRE